MWSLLIVIVAVVFFVWLINMGVYRDDSAERHRKKIAERDEQTRKQMMDDPY